MEKKDKEKAKSLINKANNELEAHNFLKANEICEEAAVLDPTNPNIYLIQLLARYEVTEIEDLQKCEINPYSNYYKKVRLYAGKELNDELDKYIPKNLSLYPEPPKIDLFAGWTNLINHTDDFFVELFLINKPFSKDRLETTEENMYTETMPSTATFIHIVEFSFIIILFALSVVLIFSDFSILKTISTVFVNFCFAFPVWKTYKKEVLNLKTNEYNSIFYINYFLRILISLFFFIILNFLYIIAFGFLLFEKQNLIPMILGAITIPFSLTQYKLIYSFLSNTYNLYKKYFPSKE